MYKFLLAAALMLATAVNYSAAQCSSRDDCPGSEVCCFTAINQFCIPFDQCVNIGDNGFGQCAQGPFGDFGGSCD